MTSNPQSSYLSFLNARHVFLSHVIPANIEQSETLVGLRPCPDTREYKRRILCPVHQKVGCLKVHIKMLSGCSEV